MLFVQVLNQKRLTAPPVDPGSTGSSGRSTPQHLRYIQLNSKDDGSSTDSRHRKPRTFSETLKMLDEDILAELDVK
jgi:hypothetical protein